MFDLIKKLTQSFGVSGNEEEIREIIKNEIIKNVDEIKVDELGNLIAVKKGTGKKIMVAAHMDEIGIIATYIDDKGFIRFSNIGGVSKHYSIGQRVRFENNIIGSLFYGKEIEEIKDIKLSNMYIDIGEKDKESTKKKISIGDTACFVGDAVLSGDMLISKALDDRIGCAVLIKVIQNMPKTENEIYFVFTVQEEIGLRGAKTSTFGINPDMAIAVDVTGTGDTPKCFPPMDVKCGGGPAIKIKDNSIICHCEAKKLLEKTAIENNIPYQFEILTYGGCDGGAIHLTRGGVPTGAISIPCRYVHSPVEMINMEDFKNSVKLLYEVLKK